MNDEQDNSAEGALESEDSGNPEDDLDSLMSEMENQQSSPEEIAQSGDLSALVTEKTDSSDDNLDEMIESAAGDSGALGDTPTDEEGIDVKFLLEMPLTMTLEVGRVKLSVNDILSLGQGSVLELHRLVGESLDIFVDGKARGGRQVPMIFPTTLFDLLLRAMATTRATSTLGLSADALPFLFFILFFFAGERPRGSHRK